MTYNVFGGTLSLTQSINQSYYMTYNVFGRTLSLTQSINQSINQSTTASLSHEAINCCNILEILNIQDSDCDLQRQNLNNFITDHHHYQVFSNLNASLDIRQSIFCLKHNNY